MPFSASVLFLASKGSAGRPFINSLEMVDRPLEVVLLGCNACVLSPDPTTQRFIGPKVSKILDQPCDIPWLEKESILTVGDPHCKGADIRHHDGKPAGHPFQDRHGGRIRSRRGDHNIGFAQEPRQGSMRNQPEEFHNFGNPQLPRRSLQEAPGAAITGEDEPDWDSFPMEPCGSLQHGFVIIERFHPSSADDPELRASVAHPGPRGEELRVDAEIASGQFGVRIPQPRKHAHHVRTIYHDGIDSGCESCVQGPEYRNVNARRKDQPRPVGLHDPGPKVDIRAMRREQERVPSCQGPRDAEGGSEMGMPDIGTDVFEFWAHRGGHSERTPLVLRRQEMRNYPGPVVMGERSLHHSVVECEEVDFVATPRKSAVDGQRCQTAICENRNADAFTPPDTDDGSQYKQVDGSAWKHIGRN